jgi:hypothetical protein
VGRRKFGVQVGGVDDLAGMHPHFLARAGHQPVAVVVLPHVLVTAEEGDLPRRQKHLLHDAVEVLADLSARRLLAIAS